MNGETHVCCRAPRGNEWGKPTSTEGFLTTEGRNKNKHNKQQTKQKQTTKTQQQQQGNKRNTQNKKHTHKNKKSHRPGTGRWQVTVQPNDGLVPQGAGCRGSQRRVGTARCLLSGNTVRDLGHPDHRTGWQGRGTKGSLGLWVPGRLPDRSSTRKRRMASPPGARRKGEGRLPHGHNNRNKKP